MSTQIVPALLDIDEKGIKRLKADAIEAIWIKTTKTIRTQLHGQPYAEKPSGYMIRLREDTQQRRVYYAAIGNNHVFFIRSGGENIFCDVAVDQALNHAD